MSDKDNSESNGMYLVIGLIVGTFTGLIIKNISLGASMGFVIGLFFSIDQN